MHLASNEGCVDGWVQDRAVVPKRLVATVLALCTIVLAAVRRMGPFIVGESFREVSLTAAPHPHHGVQRACQYACPFSDYVDCQPKMATEKMITLLSHELLSMPLLALGACAHAALKILDLSQDAIISTKATYDKILFFLHFRQV